MITFGSTTGFGNQEQRLSARGRAKPVRASDFIGPADDEIKAGVRVILVCRVSGCEQARRQNLRDQNAWLRQKRCKKAGVVIVGEFGHVGSGIDPSWLGPAVRMANELGAVLLAESTDRLIRHPDYHSETNPDAQAGERELRELEFWLDGVRAVTHLHPDATPYEVRSHQRRRGQWAKGNCGGRPSNKQPGYKKRRRDALQPRAIKLREHGLSLRGIAGALNVNESTVRGWLPPARFLRQAAEQNSRLAP